MHAYHDERRRVISPVERLLLALGHRRVLVPPALTPKPLLLQDNLPQELDVSAAEQIVPAVDVGDPLPGLRPNTLDVLRERPRLSARRTLPEPDVHAGPARRLVPRVQPHPLLHLLPQRLLLLGCTVALVASEFRLERPDEVRPRAQQHTADEVRGRDARGPLDDLEAPRLLDEAVAVVAVRVGGDVVAVDDVPAAVVGDEGERGDVGGVGDGLGDPAAGVRCGDAVSRC